MGVCLCGVEIGLCAVGRSGAGVVVRDSLVCFSVHVCVVGVRWRQLPLRVHGPGGALLVGRVLRDPRECTGTPRHPLTTPRGGGLVCQADVSWCVCMCVCRW